MSIEYYERILDKDVVLNYEVMHLKLALWKTNLHMGIAKTTMVSTYRKIQIFFDYAFSTENITLPTLEEALNLTVLSIKKDAAKTNQALVDAVVSLREYTDHQRKYQALRVEILQMVENSKKAAGERGHAVVHY